jgi:NAD+ kinase
MRAFYVISNELKDEGNIFSEKIVEYLRAKGLYVFRKGETHDFDSIDVVIVLGGDGTLLKAVREFKGKNALFMGINIGTLGFLTDADMNCYEQCLDKVLANDYIVDERMMICGKIIRDGRLIHENTALNDIVVSRCGNLRTVDYDIEVNGQYLSSYAADGVIVATATGSTAYSLSAGGPIIQPNAELIMLTPICPHTLNKRSIIFGSKDEVVIKLTDKKQTAGERIATFDGEQYFKVETGDEIVITRAQSTIKLIKTNDDSFLSRVREKLMN